jgi:hypothetical protein
MALVLADRVRETTTTTGTGTVTLAGTVTGYQSFSVIGDANTTFYAIAGQGTSEWEVGIGTYTLSGTTLARTTILASSNSGSAVNFSAGTKDVFVTYPSEKSVNLDASGDVTLAGTLTVTGATTLSSALTYGGVTLANSVTGTGSMVLSSSPTLVTPALGTPSALVGTNITGTAASLTAGNVTTNANLTGPITSSGNATSIASQTGTGTTFAMSASPTFTGTLSAAAISATTVNAALNGTLGATTPASVAATTISASSYGYFTGAGAPSGTGDGVEVKAGNILSYNRSGSAYTNLAINAGTLALQSNGNATTVGGTLSASGTIAYGTGTTTTVGLRFNSGFTNYASIYPENVTPGAANYTLIAKYDSTLVYLNSTNQVALTINATPIATATSTGLAVTGRSTVAATASQTNLASLLLSTTATTHYLGGKVTVGLGGTESGLYYGGEGSANLQFSGSTARAAIVAAIGANPLQLGSNGTIYASLSSTGLAVTGTLSATSALSVGQTITSLQTNNATVLNAASATTGYQIAINAQNTGGRLNFGLEGSTVGSLASGDSAYDTVLTTIGATGVAIGANQVVVGRFSSTGLAVTGLVDISAATSGQIKFPATQNASTNANTLDDYEEGTWTPSLGGTATYLAQGGRYTKIGRIVNFQGVLYINLIGTGSTTAITGLPFTLASGLGGAVCAVPSFSGSATAVSSMNLSINGTTITCKSNTAASATNQTANAVFANSTYLEFSGTYQV